MLEQMLKKFFENDSKAASGIGSERIKANVLSRIESEKPMKQIRIKPLIVAAAVTAVGLMSVVLTVSASNEPGASEASTLSLWNDDLRDDLLEKFDGDEAQIKVSEAFLRRHDIATEYYQGKVSEVRENGETTVTKALDSTDVTGFVEPRRIYDGHNAPIQDEEYGKDQLELIKQIEEDPEAFGLIPAGKTETFEGGLRIVNRRFINKNEFSEGGNMYYSFRRVYTNDPENKLVASIYLGMMQAENDVVKFLGRPVFELLLDHTEEGCMYAPYNNVIHWNTRNYQNDTENSAGDYVLCFADYDLKPVTGEKAVTVGTVVAVSDDGIQWLD